MKGLTADLRFVFASVAIEGLLALRNALHCGSVITGRFVDSRGNGCLFYWLSERQCFNRESKAAWTHGLPEWTYKHTAIMNQIIVNWDAQDPDSIVKGANYYDEYPEATGKLTKTQVLRVLNKVIKERLAAQDNTVTALACSA